MTPPPAATGTFSQYTGPLSSIPPTSTPGILFLISHLTAIDALDRSSPAAQKLPALLAPNATFRSNGGDAMTFVQVEAALKQRQGVISGFGHGDCDEVRVFDMVRGDGGRSVVCETVSVTVFAKDPKQEPIRVSELIMLELERAEEGKGFMGVWATEVKVYMDLEPVHRKGAEVMGLKNS